MFTCRSGCSAMSTGALEASGSEHAATAWSPGTSAALASARVGFLLILLIELWLNLSPERSLLAPGTEAALRGAPATGVPESEHSPASASSLSQLCSQDRTPCLPTRSASPRTLRRNCTRGVSEPTMLKFHVCYPTCQSQVNTQLFWLPAPMPQAVLHTTTFSSTQCGPDIPKHPQHCSPSPWEPLGGRT